MGKDSALDRFWGGPKEHYTRSFLLPKGKKPKKELGADGKLVEPDPDKYATKNLAQSILNGTTLSNGYQDVLQDIFIWPLPPGLRPDHGMSMRFGVFPKHLWAYRIYRITPTCGSIPEFPEIVSSINLFIRKEPPGKGAITGGK